MKRHICTMFELEWRQGAEIHSEFFFTEAMARAWSYYEVDPLSYDIYRTDKYKVDDHDFFYRKYLDGNY